MINSPMNLSSFPPHRNANDKDDNDICDGAKNSGKFIYK